MCKAWVYLEKYGILLPRPIVMARTVLHVPRELGLCPWNKSPSPTLDRRLPLPGENGNLVAGTPTAEKVVRVVRGRQPGGGRSGGG